MCGGIRYKHPNPETLEDAFRKVYFPRPHAEIPILDNGVIVLSQWGRRRGEDESFPVPQNGWAKQSTIQSHYWQQFEPTLHLVPALEFAEKGNLKESKWFPLPDDVFLLGLRIVRQDKSFVYVVTNSASKELEKIHPRMPLIVDAKMQTVAFDIPTDDEKQLELFG